MSSAADQLKEAARDSSDTVAEYSSALGGHISKTAHRTSRQVTDGLSQMKEKTSYFITEQPLVFAAIGFAVGAGIGAILASTGRENQLMGSASDAAKDTLGQAVSERMKGAKVGIGRIADQAKKVGATSDPAAPAQNSSTLPDEVTHENSEPASAGSSAARPESDTDEQV